MERRGQLVPLVQPGQPARRVLTDLRVLVVLRVLLALREQPVRRETRERQE